MLRPRTTAQGYCAVLLMDTSSVSPVCYFKRRCREERVQGSQVTLLEVSRPRAETAGSELTYPFKFKG